MSPWSAVRNDASTSEDDAVAPAADRYVATSRRFSARADEPSTRITAVVPIRRIEPILQHARERLRRAEQAVHPAGVYERDCGAEPHWVAPQLGHLAVYRLAGADRVEHDAVA